MTVYVKAFSASRASRASKAEILAVRHRHDNVETRDTLEFPQCPPIRASGKVLDQLGSHDDIELVIRKRKSVGVGQAPFCAHVLESLSALVHTDDAKRKPGRPFRESIGQAPVATTHIKDRTNVLGDHVKHFAKPCFLFWRERTSPQRLLLEVRTILHIGLNNEDVVEVRHKSDAPERRDCPNQQHQPGRRMGVDVVGTDAP